LPFETAGIQCNIGRAYVARPFFARFLGKNDIFLAASTKYSKKYHFACALIGYFGVSIR
jgi:hypothetical protein